MSRWSFVLRTGYDRKRAIELCRSLKAETRVEFKQEKRSLEQNARLWAMLGDIAKQVEHNGRHYSTDQWKVLFMHACGREVQFLPALDNSTFIPWGQSSSDLSKQEMSDLIEFMVAWGAERGVAWSDPTQPPLDAFEQESAANVDQPANDPRPKLGTPPDSSLTPETEEPLDERLRAIGFELGTAETPDEITKLWAEARQRAEVKALHQRAPEVLREIVQAAHEKARDELDEEAFDRTVRALAERAGQRRAA